MAEHTFLVEGDLPTSDSLSPAGEEPEEGAPVISMFGRGVGYPGTYLLTFIYAFFILDYRHRFRKFSVAAFS